MGELTKTDEHRHCEYWESDEVAVRGGSTLFYGTAAKVYVETHNPVCVTTCDDGTFRFYSDIVPVCSFWLSGSLVIRRVLAREVQQ